MPGERRGPAKREWLLVVRTAPTGRVSLTLRAKYLILVGVAVVTATVAVSVPYFLWIERLTVANATDSLDSEAELVATQVKLNIERLRDDVLTVSRMPPMLGIIRSTRNGGVDPLDGSTLEDWHDRLQTIFTSIMENRADYVQMRFIGLEDEGLELVRVDKDTDDRIQASEPEDLQPKGSEPYFREGLTLAPDEVYFSEITPNIDFGRREFDNPMLRAVTPIADRGGRVFGLLVINAHFGRMVRGILEQVPPSPDLYIVTAAGDYVHRSAEGRIDDLVLAEGGGGLPALLGRAVEQEGPALHGAITRVYDDRVVSTVRFAPAVKTTIGIGVVLTQSRDELLREVFDARRRAAILALGLILAMTVPGFLVSRWLTAPLLRLATALRARTPDDAEPDLPTDRGDEVGEVARALETLIARRRRIEAIQASTLARLQSILDNTVDAIVTMDGDRRIQSFNKGAVRILGYTAEEIIGRTADELLLAPILDGPTGEIREQEIRTRNGRHIPVELSVSEVRTADGLVFNCIIREIGERKRLEAALAAHAAALERSNTELEEFAYIASHDLKEPLRAISNHTQFLAEDHGDKLDEDGLRRIARLQELCARADRLITELLQFSRLGSDDLKIEAVDLGALAEQVRADLADTLAERNATLRISSDLPTVRGDRTRLASLLHNLAVNGLKYNDAAEPQVEIGVAQDGPDADTHAQTDASRVTVYVRDNGIGIAPEFQDTVFKIFKRLNSDKTYGPGSGVGLSFARKIVERHGGRLSFEAAPGGGTTFFFDLQGRTTP